MSAPFFDMDVDYAFPFVLSEKYLCTGMTLRDYFAAKAMQGLLARGLHYSTENKSSPRHGLDDEDIAGHAYTMADAMLLSRSKS